MGASLRHDLRCPRCDARGVRELGRLPQERHAVFMCSFCKHTWCEEGRRAPQEAGAPNGPRGGDGHSRG